MTQLSFVKNGFDYDAIEACGIARPLGQEAPDCEPRKPRLGLLLVSVGAVVFYGAMGALIWHFI
jgi:hypothetical protein